MKQTKNTHTHTNHQNETQQEGIKVDIEMKTHKNTKCKMNNKLVFKKCPQIIAKTMESLSKHPLTVKLTDMQKNIVVVTYNTLNMGKKDKTITTQTNILKSKFIQKRKTRRFSELSLVTELNITCECMCECVLSPALIICILALVVLVDKSSRIQNLQQQKSGSAQQIEVGLPVSNT